MSSDGILDALVTQFADAAAQMFFELRPVTLSLAAALFTLHFAWTIGFGALRDDDLFAKALHRVAVFLVLFGLISVSPFWLPAIPHGFSWLGERLTGIGLSPSAVFAQGLNLAFTFFDSWGELVSLVIPAFGTLRIVMMLTILVAFGLIAIQIARVLVEVALALGPLTVSLAFLGHGLTWGIFEAYLRYLVELGIKIYVLYIVVGVTQNLGRTWDEALQSFSSFVDLRLHFTIALATVFIAVLALALPGQIASRIAGGLSFSGLNPMSRSQ